MLDRIPELEKLDNRDLQNTFTKVFAQALNNPIVLDSAPTTSGKELKADQLGFNGGKLYINVSGTIYEINMTAV